MHSRTVGSAGTAVVVALAAACSKPPPPPPPAAQRTTCGEVLSVALPAGFTCTPKPTPVVTAAFVEGPRVRLVLLAAPHLAPGDSSTDRPLRRGERLRVLPLNGRTAKAIVTEGGLWESQMAVWVPDAGNGDRLVALARWQAEADEAVAADIIASTRVLPAPGAVPDSEPSVPPPSGPGAPPAPAVLPPSPVVPGGDPAGWLRHFAGFQVSFAAPAEFDVATHDPTEGANVSLNGKHFEVHVYLSPDGVRSVAAQGQDTVTSESIVVDGPQGQLHRWHRASGGRPGRPFELELQARLSPDVHLSVFASCQTAAACGTAETILRSIRVVQRP
jgi:hypothetical protein